MNKMILLSTAVMLSACGGSGNNAVENSSVNKQINTEIVDQDFTNGGYQLNHYSIKLGDRIFEAKGDNFHMDFNHLPQGLVRDTYEEYVVETKPEGKQNHYKTTGDFRAYNRFYSVVIGNNETGHIKNGNDMGGVDPFEISGVAGRATQFAELPERGHATYIGSAFTIDDDRQNQQGDFTYNVDFGNKTGKGSYSLGGEITVLEKTQFARLDNVSANEEFHDQNGMSGKKSQVAGLFIGESAAGDRYVLGLYGPNAEEIAGYAKQSKRSEDGAVDIRDSVGLSGKRGSIQYN